MPRFAALKIRPTLLLAATAAGVLAPVTAVANEISSLNGREAINDYMEQQEIDELKALRSRNQVTSFNQFSDVRPTDLAYQALTNLVKNMVAWPAIPTAPTRVGRP